MNSINVDHAELSEFSAYLSNEGAGNFNDIKVKIEGALANIQANGWSDNKFQEFYDIFQKSKKDIDEISQLMQSYSSYLATKAQKVGEYQSYNVF